MSKSTNTFIPMNFYKSDTGTMIPNKYLDINGNIVNLCSNAVVLQKHEIAEYLARVTLPEGFSIEEIFKDDYICPPVYENEDCFLQQPEHLEEYGE